MYKATWKNGKSLDAEEGKFETSVSEFDSSFIFGKSLNFLCFLNHTAVLPYSKMRFIDWKVISNCTDLLESDPDGLKMKDSLRPWKQNQKFKIHLEG